MSKATCDLLTALGLALYGVGIVLVWPFVADDAFIVGRYAQNAVAGHGLVFNINEPVSALTSPLHALLMVPLAWMHADPVALYRVIAVVLPPLGWLITVRMVALEPVQRAFFTVFSLASPFLAIWTVGGLETPILCLLLSIFASVIVTIYRANAASDSQFLGLGVLAGLIFLTRYDSVLVTLPAMLALAVIYRNRAALWRAAALSLAIAASWLIYAQLTYGEVWPTSAHVKLGYLSLPFSEHAVVSVNFLILSGTLLGLVPVIANWRKAGRPIGDVRAALQMAGAITLVLAGVYAAFAAAQHMMFAYRFFVPYLPVLGLLLALAQGQRLRWIPAAILALQLSNLGIAVTTGLHVSLLRSIPGVGQAGLEMKLVTPKNYRQFTDILRQDAADLRDHWAGQGVTTRPPRIFLYTGGMAYWLPEFYVYEALVSFRHDCGDLTQLFATGSDYVQGIGLVPVNSRMEELTAGRVDFQAGETGLFRSEIILDHPTYAQYFHGPDPAKESIPPRTKGVCAGFSGG